MTAPTSLAHVDSSNVTVDEIIDILDRDGGVIIDNLFTPDQMDELKKDIQPSLDEYAQNGAKPFPTTTKVVYGLVAKSPVCYNDIAQNPLLLGVCNKVLTIKQTNLREDIVEKLETPPILSVSVSMSVQPGGSRQKLHRDSFTHAVTGPVANSIYDSVQIGCLIAGTDITKENGATLVIPGSHKWQAGRVPTIQEAIPAEMKRGSVLIFSGNLYHAGGQNVTSNQERIVHGFFFCHGNLRHEENPYLAIPFKDILKLPEPVQKLLGYSSTSSLLGTVKLVDPMSEAAGGLTKVFNDLIV